VVLEGRVKTSEREREEEKKRGKKERDDERNGGVTKNKSIQAWMTPMCGQCGPGRLA
jgi:hypothetical protein